MVFFVRFHLENNKVFLLQDTHCTQRGTVLVEHIQNALNMFPLPSDHRSRTFVIDLEDFANENISSDFCIATVPEKAHTLFPDSYSFAWPQVGIPSVQDLSLQMFERGQLPPKDQRVVWLGVITHPNRRVFLERCRLPDLADRVDAREVIWSNPYRPLLSLPDHADYKYLIDIEGAGWSARIKYLLCAGRPTFITERPFWDWVTWDLVPWKHYIPVARDCSDLLEKMDWAEQHAEEAETIAKAGQELMMQRLKYETLYRAMHDLLLSKLQTECEQIQNA